MKSAERTIRQRIDPLVPKRKTSAKRKGPSARDLTPCQIATAAKNAAITEAAQKLIVKEDKDAEASTAAMEYDDAIMVAMAATMVEMEVCSV